MLSRNMSKSSTTKKGCLDAVGSRTDFLAPRQYRRLDIVYQKSSMRSSQSLNIRVASLRSKALAERSWPPSPLFKNCPCHHNEEEMLAAACWNILLPPTAQTFAA
jgi:hypothetical protein